MENTPVSASNHPKDAPDSNDSSKLSLKKIILTNSFLEKVTILILTILLTGFVIPLIWNRIQTRKSKNEIVLQSQAKLLDDITNSIFKYETLALDVSFYKADSTVNNDTLHEIAFQRYSNRVVDIFSEWRLQTVKAGNLFSTNTSNKFTEFIDKIRSTQDASITSLYHKGSPEEWVAMHKINQLMLTNANKLISEMAIDLKITKSDIR
jgi:hypothetical protein